MGEGVGRGGSKKKIMKNKNEIRKRQLGQFCTKLSEFSKNTRSVNIGPEVVVGQELLELSPGNSVRAKKNSPSSEFEAVLSETVFSSSPKWREHMPFVVLPPPPLLLPLQPVFASLPGPFAALSWQDARWSSFTPFRPAHQKLWLQQFQERKAIQPETWQDRRLPQKGSELERPLKSTKITGYQNQSF